MNKSINAYRTIRVFGAAVITLVTLGNASFADSPDSVTKSLTVKYDDLNVNTAAGAASLYSRIHAAARQVCAAPYDNNRDLASFAAKNACIQKSEARAVGDVHSGALAAYYAKKNGRALTLLASNRVE
jgi:UrcA family protein